MARMVLAEFGSREATCIGLRWQAVHSSLSPNCRMECSERVEPFPVELTECGLPVFLNSPHLSAVVGNVLPRFCMVTPDFGFGGFLWVTLETSEAPSSSLPLVLVSFLTGRDMLQVFPDVGFHDSCCLVTFRYSRASWDEGGGFCVSHSCDLCSSQDVCPLHDAACSVRLSFVGVSQQDTQPRGARRTPGVMSLWLLPSAKGFLADQGRV